MTAEDWQNIGSVAVFVVIGGWGAWQAHKAKKFAEPTGNGFAKGVKDALSDLQEKASDQAAATTRIEEAQARDSGMLYDHIKAHANADVMKGVHRDSASDPNSP